MPFHTSYRCKGLNGGNDVYALTHHVQPHAPYIMLLVEALMQEYIITTGDIWR